MTEAEINAHIALLQQELAKYPDSGIWAQPANEQMYAWKYIR